MLKTVVLLLFFLLTPAVILRLCALLPWLNKLGAVMVCYVVGFALAQTGWMSDEKMLFDVLTVGTILLALPMLFFEVDIRSWRRLAKPALVSLCCALVGLIAVVTVSTFFFRDDVPDTANIAGLLTGVYTGGTANMASIQAALHVDSGVFIAVNTIDMVAGAVYMLLMISIAPRLIRRFLPVFPNPERMTTIDLKDHQVLPFREWLRIVPFSTIWKSLAISLLLSAAGAGLGLLVHNEAMQMATIVLTITTFGILASNLKAVRKLEGSFDVGIYLILVFSIAVASMADFRSLADSSLNLIAYISVVMFGAVFAHLLLCKLFKVDADTMIVTSVALINSVPFVPAVCNALNNKTVMVSGVTVGIIGYAIGNYVGIGIALLLRWFGLG